jgi:enoyl-CoA hydratase/carnithine racemase
MSEHYAQILVEDRGDIQWVTINRIRDRNSINTSLMEELEHMLAETEQTSMRAVVFTGAGDTHFVGGADGIEMMQLDPEGALAFSERIQSLFNRMEESPLILVAAINGLCFGGGFEFAMACDLRVASEEARIGLPEVKVGLIPGGGGTQRLPRIVGMGRAMDMILSGRLCKGREALDFGLVSRVAPKDQLSKEVEKLLAHLFRNPQYALSLAKRAVYASRGRTFERGLREESNAFSQCFSHDFFPDLMVKQLREGVLTTTAELPEWFHRKGRQGA